MTDTNQTTPNPTAILLEKTGCANAGELNARILASQQEIANRMQVIQALQNQRRPFVEKAEKHEQCAGLLLVATLAFPPAAIVFGPAAVVEGIKSLRPRAIANAHTREIVYNDGRIHQDTTFIQQGQQALVEAQCAAAALQSAQTARLQSPGMC